MASRSTFSSTMPASNCEADGRASTAEWRKVIETNLTSAFVIGREAAKRMIPRGRGKMINIGSLTSELARATVAPYTVAKGGIKMLTRAMTAEWAGHGIQANAIGPGYMMTDMNQALVDNPTFDAWVKGRTPSRAGAGRTNLSAPRSTWPPRFRLRQWPDHLRRRRNAGGALSEAGKLHEYRRTGRRDRRNSMLGVIIHAPEGSSGRGSRRPLHAGPHDVQVRIKPADLRLGSALLPSRRLWHGADPGADGARSRDRRHGREVGAEVSRVSRRPAGRGESQPALRPLPLLPRRPAQPVPRHAFHRQRDALSPCPGRLSPKPDGR